MLNLSIGQDPVEIEGVAVDRLADVGFVIEAEDVQGERAQQGKDAWVAANTAAVFTQGFVADPVQAVLDVPMASTCGLAAGVGLELQRGGSQA
jgi:hypothetical protein